MTFHVPMVSRALSRLPTTFLGGLRRSHDAAVLQLLALYVVVHVVRASAIAAFAPLLRRLGYGLTFGEGKPHTLSQL